jgi:hypothetical protein
MQSESFATCVGHQYKYAAAMRPTRPLHPSDGSNLNPVKRPSINPETTAHEV